MTKRETAEVQRAIRELMNHEDGGNFTAAIGRLCRLVGWRYPASEIKGRPVTLQEVMRRFDGVTNDD
jgi:hypothetical protein